MKIKVIENEKNFGINLNPENMQEAALLTRLGMNHTKQVELFTDVYSDGVFHTFIRIIKHRRASSRIVNRGTKNG